MLRTLTEVLLTAVFRTPFRPRAAHVMTFRTISVAGGAEKVLKSGQHRNAALAQRIRGGEEGDQHGFLFNAPYRARRRRTSQKPRCRNRRSHEASNLANPQRRGPSPWCALRGWLVPTRP